MDIILIHIGDKLPEYIHDCVTQILKYSKSAVWVVHSNKIKYTPPADNVFSVPLEELIDDPRVKEFKKFDVTKVHGEFWSLAFMRMFILEVAMKKLQIKSALHIENDVLIYEDPARFSFSRDVVWATPVGPKYTTYAYCHVPSLSSLQFLNNGHLQVLAEGYDVLNSRYGEGMVNEMLVAKELQDKGLICGLPVLPVGEASANFEEFIGLFDGASWGQFCFGTPGNPQSFVGAHHYVGAELILGNYKVEWKFNEKTESVKVVNGKVAEISKIKLREPYVVNRTGIEFKLFNLHVHSKNLKLGM